mmetsp:Transcript_19711/g.50464  ORF Transcript_19711/g.50464 Transcript_19711/m.50464 type:complete len:335 (-) Transcript_19711:21-1025(-)
MVAGGGARHFDKTEMLGSPCFAAAPSVAAKRMSASAAATSVAVPDRLPSPISGISGSTSTSQSTTGRIPGAMRATSEAASARLSAPKRRRCRSRSSATTESSSGAPSTWPPQPAWRSSHPHWPGCSPSWLATVIAPARRMEGFPAVGPSSARSQKSQWYSSSGADSSQPPAVLKVVAGTKAPGSSSGHRSFRPSAAAASEASASASGSPQPHVAAAPVLMSTRSVSSPSEEGCVGSVPSMGHTRGMPVSPSTRLGAMTEGSDAVSRLARADATSSRYPGESRIAGLMGSSHLPRASSPAWLTSCAVVVKPSGISWKPTLPPASAAIRCSSVTAA